MAMQTTDKFGVFRPSLGKDFNSPVSDLVTLLNTGLIDQNELVDNSDGTYTYTSYDGATTFVVDTNAASTPIAADVTIADAGNHFTSTEVEGALQELGQCCADYTLNRIEVYDNATILLGYLIAPAASI